ncbi:hypothetical protein FKP32DRAFT_1588243 [Trametes sanguinea]|nr:hypothetical protein FKP32DRAFT_1588243 [Trametes sanguinea]
MIHRRALRNAWWALHRSHSLCASFMIRISTLLIGLHFAEEKQQSSSTFGSLSLAGNLVLACFVLACFEAFAFGITTWCITSSYSR